MKNPISWHCFVVRSALCFKHIASGSKPQASERILFVGGRHKDIFADSRQ